LKRKLRAIRWSAGQLYMLECRVSLRETIALRETVSVAKLTMI
jgi:hypothetical protein